MKILHALVGYLAITALPFHPFACASNSPLAAISIDHDSIQVVETCQTVSTQNHAGDSALMKCVPGDLDTSDILEARQGEIAEIIPTFIVIFSIAASVVLSIIWIEGDNPKREAFTRNTIDAMTAKWPKFNWVICHPSYSVNFDGVEGQDYGYTHHELPISFGRTIGYDLYWARSGTFQRYGDGGFINWMYNGNILGTEDDGAIVHFGVIS